MIVNIVCELCYSCVFSRYLMFNNTLPEHALSATKILYLASKSAPIQSDLVTLFTEEKVCRSEKKLCIHLQSLSLVES